LSETVRIQPVESTWDAIGGRVLPGVQPADLQLVWDEHGPLTCGFTLPGVSPKRALRELEAYTPLDVLGDSDDPVWTGRIVETPGGRDGVTVSAEGGQAYLDDHAQPIFYMHENLNDWQDVRSFPTANLASWRTAGQIASGQQGATVLMKAANNLWKGSATQRDPMGIYLDMGPGVLAVRVSVDFERVDAAMDVDCNIAWSNTSPDALPAGQVTRFTNLNPATGLPASGSANLSITGSRYVTIYLASGSAADATYPTLDAMLKIKSVRVATVDAYFSGAASVLTASTVFADAVARVPKLTLGDVAATSFLIRGMGGPGDEGTPRDRIERANGYHGYRWWIDARLRANLQPQPASPRLVVNTEDEGVDYEDTSLNSGRDLYSDVIVNGRTGGGTPVRRQRTLSSSVPARRGITRSQTLNAQAPILDADGDLLGDTFLLAHARPPMKGSLTITGNSVTDLLTGRKLSPLEVASRAGELIRMLDLPDPLTGDIGRDVRIITGTWGKGQASITLDEDRSRWEALMARMAAVQGG
jgi:hypothetical protein